MIPDEELDERLRRILDDGSASAQPAELAELRTQLAQEPDTSGDMPRGTEVVFAEPELEVSAPVRKPIVPRAPAPPQEKVVQVPSGPEQDPDRVAAAYARAQDRKARQAMSMERGGREMVAALTRTQVQPVTQRPTDAFDRYYRQMKDKKAEGRAGEQLNLGRQKADFEAKEAARKAAVDEQRRKEDLEGRNRDDARADKGQALTADGIAATRENTKVMQGIAVGNYGIHKDEAAAKKAELDDKKTASAIPLLGGTLNLTPGLSDTDRTRAREVAGLWNASDAAVENFQKTLEDFARNPNNESKGRVTAALRTASSAFNSAIGGGAMSGDEARAMSDAMGADIISPTGIQALTQSLFGDDGKAAATISSRVRAARQANRVTALGRLKTSGTFSEGGSAPTAPGASDGKITVTNGKETLRIPVARLADAELDGFKRVQ